MLDQLQSVDGLGTRCVAEARLVLEEGEAQISTVRIFDTSTARVALALADELGMRPLVAHHHLGLGKLYRRTGKRQDAYEHLATATAMYRDMDMRFWLES